MFAILSLDKTEPLFTFDVDTLEAMTCTSSISSATRFTESFKGSATVKLDTSIV